MQIPADSTESVETVVGLATWFACSVGMTLFNKLAVKAFPVECTLVALQMASAVIVLTCFFWKSIHIGSWRDMLRWITVVPFFTGMLLTSIVALKHSAMTLIVVFRSLAPVLALCVESCFPKRLHISIWMIVAIAFMAVGATMYCTEDTSLNQVFWILLNIFFSVTERLLQRLMLAKDQYPVDISKTGVTLLNNLFGMIPLIFVAILTREHERLPDAFVHLHQDLWNYIWVVASCIVGVAISYCGIWVQSLISATSFLVLVQFSRFVIVLIECFAMKTKSLTGIQHVGVCITLLASFGYGKARLMVEAEQKHGESERLLPTTVPGAMKK